MSHIDFKAILASRGCHVYTERAWSDAKVNDKVKTEIETNHGNITTQGIPSLFLSVKFLSFS